MFVSERIVDQPGTTLTRPANTTAYSANDSISNDSTNTNVIPLPVSLADFVGQQVIFTEVHLATTDTGLGAGVQVRLYLYRSDPTLSSGVKAGDNAAFSNNMAGAVGTFIGTFHAMADGGFARLTPEEGNFLIALPERKGKRYWYQLQALAGFTPSANSTTIIPRFKGFQGRA